jgi:hypothetical protein
MYNNRKNIYLLVTVFFSVAQMARGEAKEMKMDSNAKKAVIESVSHLIIERYVLPDAAQQIADYLNKKFTLSWSLLKKVDLPKRLKKQTWLWPRRSG